ncbi:hypothetical protein Tco_1398319 [Tanacetum coccineum]
MGLGLSVCARERGDKGTRLWGKVWVSCECVLERWFGLKPWGSGGLGFGGKAVVVQLCSGSGLTADSSVLTLTLAFLDFGLDFAQSFPFHAQFCHFGLDGNDKLHHSPSSLTLQRNLQKDGLESSPSSVLNDTLHDKVSHSERYRNPGHADCDHCRMPEAGKEANDQKWSKSKTLQEEEGPERVDLTEQTNNSFGKVPHMDSKPGTYDGSWRICIDFKNLNSACLKDYYSLPDIDGKIVSVVGFRYKCFLDAYKGYHQVQMAQDDEEKTAFYTNRGTYCYTKMSFGLKNAGATYQRLVDMAFQS